MPLKPQMDLRHPRAKHNYDHRRSNIPCVNCSKNTPPALSNETPSNSVRVDVSECKSPERLHMECFLPSFCAYGNLRNGPHYEPEDGKSKQPHQSLLSIIK